MALRLLGFVLSVNRQQEETKEIPAEIYLKVDPASVEYAKKNVIPDRNGFYWTGDDQRYLSANGEK